MSELEPLYFGDIRLDALYNSLTEEIHSRCEGQDITYASIVGVLEMIKHDLLTDIQE